MSHVNMIIIFLLVFSLTTVPAWGTVKIGCEGGWVRFACESPNNDSLPINRTGITKDETNGLNVTVKNLQREDNETLCLKKTEIKIRIRNCTQTNHTAYNVARTTLECGRPDSNPKFGEVYLCKESGDFDCENVLSLNTQKYSKTVDTNGLNITITNVTSEDQGIYWCVEREYKYVWSYRKINITVRSDFPDHQEYPVFREELKHSCDYSTNKFNNKFKNKLFCKGEDPVACVHLVTTKEPSPQPEKFTLDDDFQNKRLTVTIFNITAEDKGIYWFGAGNSTEHENEIFCRLELTEGPPLFQEPKGRSPGNTNIVSIITLCVCVVVLVLLVVVLIHNKKCKRRNESAPQDTRREELVYEEIAIPATREAVTTVYATVDACKESLNYVTIDFGKSGSSSQPKPSTSRCEYSTVSKTSADKCTVHTAPSGEPLYVNVGTHK